MTMTQPKPDAQDTDTTVYDVVVVGAGFSGIF